MLQKIDRSVFFNVAFTAGLVIAIESVSSVASACDDHDAIYQVIEQWMTYWEDGDVAGIASLYTENAVMYAPNLEPLVGREAIAGFIQGMMNAGIVRNVLETELLLLNPVSFKEQSVMYDYQTTAHEIGHYSLYADGIADAIDEGPYMVLWVKKEGQWMLHRDMLNSGRTQ
jgi:uncharacterized protein (TIGR02246 family)